MITLIDGHGFAWNNGADDFRAAVRTAANLLHGIPGNSGTLSVKFYKVIEAMASMTTGEVTQIGVFEQPNAGNTTRLTIQFEQDKLPSDTDIQAAWDDYTRESLFESFQMNRETLGRFSVTSSRTRPDWMALSTIRSHGRPGEYVATINQIARECARHISLKETTQHPLEKLVQDVNLALASSGVFKDTILNAMKVHIDAAKKATREQLERGGCHTKTIGGDDLRKWANA